MEKEDLQDHGCAAVVALVLVFTLVALVGLSGCSGHLGPAGVDIDFKEWFCEESQTYVKPLPVSVGENGRTSTDRLRTSSPWRYGADVDGSPDQGEPIKYARDAPDGCQNPPLVRAKSAHVAPGRN